MKKYIGFIICIPLFAWFEFLTLSYDIEQFPERAWQIRYMTHTALIFLYFVLALCINSIINLNRND